PGRASARPIRVLVLSPTRELASQLADSFGAYGHHLDFRTCVVFGGVGQNGQTRALSRGVDILVATPGRLLDLMGQGLVRFESLEMVVLDEADRMLDMGFIESTAINHRESARERSETSSRATPAYWSQPTSPRAVSTSRGFRTSSTTISRTYRK